MFLFWCTVGPVSCFVSVFALRKGCCTAVANLARTSVQGQVHLVSLICSFTLSFFYSTLQICLQIDLAILSFPCDFYPNLACETTKFGLVL